MYPQVKNQHSEKFCCKCHLLTCACLCEKVPRLKTEAVFFLLVHSRELSKGSNTGHLLLNALVSCEYELWSRVEQPKKLMPYLKDQNLKSQSYQPYLVFSPDENPPKLSSDTQSKSDAVENHRSAGQPDKILNQKRPLYILIDATWQQARKMVRQSPYLTTLPRMSLHCVQKSHYRLRRNQQAEGMSSCEAAIALLQQSGDLDSANALQAYFQAFMLHYDASMSGHGVSRVPLILSE